ncbi:MAG: hypothetical protein CL777_00480 [Chloroflexi bacterium]|nr:hypothetical protein [Chloroflexota bacterium]|tara:strand:- start:4611 stop:4796 length:186 start_codon:yes stop_codon:yes gene_type:complete
MYRPALTKEEFILLAKNVGIGGDDAYLSLLMTDVQGMLERVEYLSKAAFSNEEPNGVGDNN